MKTLTWQKPGQQNVAQELIKIIINYVAELRLYNSLTKQPISAIEVDGWHFHKENDAQLSRDKLKNQIFTKLGLPLIRISTTDTVNQETIKKSLLAIL